ncbi:hypothetical protein ELP00_23250 [Salmonella enterica subsp. enterica serovar Kiambu]|nr:hypothetical protein [Salmonella enterica subsp. enterica serovar Kiambu]
MHWFLPPSFKSIIIYLLLIYFTSDCISINKSTLIESFGRQRKVARTLGISELAVSYWSDIITKGA